MQLSNQVNEFIPVSKGGFGVHMDKNRPLWGFADTHAHPTHQLGFGGQTIGGDTDGNIATALSSDKCSSIHGGCSVNDAVCLAVQKPFVLLSNGHATDGWPNFLGWPRFTTMYHQQQHVDWIKRAYEGGLRLMCALGVTNMYWATRALGAGIAPGAAIDDETVSLQQINLMKDIARRNATWMEIAYTPTDARRIIAQNKLAVVLGVEMDNFGNFKDNSYTWIDGGSYSIPPSARLETLPADNAVAQQRIGQKLDHYYTLGIRQVTPLHYITGVFGGTSIFQYRTGLVNHAFTARSALKGGQHKGVFFHLADDFDPLTTILGNLGEILRSGSQVTCDGCQVSTINSIGLTDKGQLLATQLMRKGFLIDLEHMSYESIDGLFSIANRFNYPILSSHTDPAALSFKPVMTQRFTGSDENKWRTFGTTNIRNLPHEGQLLDENYLRISNSGGTVGVIALPYRKKTYVGWRGSVANDCDGSSKTWAQMYLHSLDKMGGKGVALSTDRGFVHFIGPRFGTNAAYTLSEEKIDPLKKNLRTLQRYAQTNGVRYDRPIQTWHPARFDQDVKDVDTWEIDIWKALAAWTCRVTLAQVPNSSEPLHWGRIRSFVKGLYATNELQLTTPLPIGTGDGPWEESAMYCLKNNILPDAMLRWNRNDIHNNVWRIYRQVKPVWDLWQRMSGNNEPLRRGITGTRDWDINLDGIAHYGMLPDFLQDLKNIGLSTLQLQPLFNSAEDYIQMWEKAERAKVSVISGRLATIEAYAKSEEPVEVSNAVQVYPNPTLGLVTVKVNWPVETLSDVKLYNTLGGILYSGTLKNSLEVNLTGLRGGLYYLVVENQQAGLKRSVKVFKR
jgi:microsomal dipeptidase-like Zn-dependent dipeptidase